MVFWPGYHRDQLYTAEECERIAPNFTLCRRWVDPVVKIGHSKDQGLVKKRLKESSGFFSLGDFQKVATQPGSRVAVWLANIPTEIGGLVNANRLRSGSVELIPFMDDPRDQSKRLEGPIMTGLSLLGEEHPALKGVRIPQAVFADGRPVPANHNMAPWFAAMAGETRDMTSGFSERWKPTPKFWANGCDMAPKTICFSEMTPMLDKAFLDSLGLTPEQVEAILAKEGGGAGDPAAGATPADTGAPPGETGVGGGGPLPPPPDTTGGAAPLPPIPPTPLGGKDDKKKDGLSQDNQTMPGPTGMAAEFAEMKKRFGALEKAYSEKQKEEEKCMSAAFSERVDRVLKQNFRRIPPNLRASFKQLGMATFRTKQFSEVKYDDGEKAFAAFVATVESMPESTKFSSEIVDSKGPSTLAPHQVETLNCEAFRRSWIGTAVRNQLLPVLQAQTAPPANGKK